MSDSQQIKPEPTDFNSKRLKPNQGIIFMSLIRDNSSATFTHVGLSMEFVNDQDGGQGSLSFPAKFSGFGNAFPTNDGRKMTGGVMAYTLPAGHYHLKNYRMINSNPYFTQIWSAREDFDIPFTVRPGRATYLGEIEADGVHGKNLLGFNALAAAVFRISSNPGRDIPLFMKKYPGIDPSLIVTSPIEAGNVPVELVQIQ